MMKVQHKCETWFMVHR